MIFTGKLHELSQKYRKVFLLCKTCGQRGVSDAWSGGGLNLLCGGDSAQNSRSFLLDDVAVSDAHDGGAF